MIKIRNATKRFWFTVATTINELGRIPGRIRERREYEEWLDKQAEEFENERLIPFAGMKN